MSRIPNNSSITCHEAKEPDDRVVGTLQPGWDSRDYVPPVTYRVVQSSRNRQDRSQLPNLGPEPLVFRKCPNQTDLQLLDDNDFCRQP